MLTPCVSWCCRMMSGLSEWFWQERLWFPEGLGWADLEDREGRVYAKAQDLWVALPIALVFLVIRQIFERSVHFSLCHTQYLCYSSICLWLLIQTLASSIFTFFSILLSNLTLVFSPWRLPSHLFLSPLVCPSVISSSDLQLHYFTSEWRFYLLLSFLSVYLTFPVLCPTL